MAGYIGTQAVSVNTTSATISDDLTVGDNVSLTSDSAVLNIGAGNDLKITHDGTNGDFESAGILTFDVAGNIILDADGAEIIFKDGGVQFGEIYKSGNDLRLESNVSNGNLVFSGNDGGTGVVALTLDMSEAGTAIFNHDIVVASANGVGDITLGGHLRLKTLDDAANEWLVYNYNDDDLHFHFTGSGNSDVIMHNDGDLQILDGNLVVAQGHGIDFSAQTATSASGTTTTSELLDHYEEGTWQPSVKAGAEGTVTYQTQVGRFTRVGRTVQAEFYLRVSFEGDGLQLQIQGLPFVNAAASPALARGWGGAGYMSVGQTPSPQFYGSAGANFFSIFHNGSTSTFVADGASVSQQYMIGMYIYDTDA